MIECNSKLNFRNYKIEINDNEPKIIELLSIIYTKNKYELEFHNPEENILLIQQHDKFRTNNIKIKIYSNNLRKLETFILNEKKKQNSNITVIIKAKEKPFEKFCKYFKINYNITDIYGTYTIDFV